MMRVARLVHRERKIMGKEEDIALRVQLNRIRMNRRMNTDDIVFTLGIVVDEARRIVSASEGGSDAVIRVVEHAYSAMSKTRDLLLYDAFTSVGYALTEVRLIEQVERADDDKHDPTYNITVWLAKVYAEIATVRAELAIEDSILRLWTE
jgi:hypothetical protein